MLESSGCHPGVIRVSSGCHPGVIRVSSRCHSGVILVSSRCHPGEMGLKTYFSAVLPRPETQVLSARFVTNNVCTSKKFFLQLDSTHRSYQYTILDISYVPTYQCTGEYVAENHRNLPQLLWLMVVV